MLQHDPWSELGPEAKEPVTKDGPGEGTKEAETDDSGEAKAPVCESPI